jgi:hypothetical protein
MKDFITFLRGYKDKKLTMGIKAPPPLAILIAMAVCRCDNECIAQCNMSRWLHQKPLDAPVGQLLAPYCPGGYQGCRQKNNNEKMHQLGLHFNGHGYAPVQYPVHHLMEEVHGFPRNHWTLPLGKYLLQ